MTEISSEDVQGDFRSLDASELWQYRFLARVDPGPIYREVLERPVGGGDWWLRVYDDGVATWSDGLVYVQPLGRTFDAFLLSARRREAANRALEKAGYDPAETYLKLAAEGFVPDGEPYEPGFLCK